jgi:hypothetical protein
MLCQSITTKVYTRGDTEETTRSNKEIRNEEDVHVV